MVRFRTSFRMQWSQSRGPIYPNEQSPKSSSGTLAMAYRVPGYGNAINLPRSLANFVLSMKQTSKLVNNA